jgi:O-antigen/teichoic acid export membrane protein
MRGSAGSANRLLLSRFKRNVAANLAGRVCIAVLGLVFVPVIIRLMGIEAYGLVSFFATVQALFSILDLGLSATINRELARLAAGGNNAEDTRDTVRTLELCYWGIALVIAGAMIALTPVVPRWVHPEHLTARDLHQAVVIMGVVTALQWPLSFYDGGLMGIQRQVTGNVINVSMTVLRQAGGVLVLWLVSPSIQTFLIWQAFTSGLQTALTALFLWRSLPRSSAAPRFRRASVVRVWRFAAGLTGTSVVTLGLTQIDKVVLSRFLPLEQFGYYALAAVAAGGLHYLIGPVFSAAFPRFSELLVSSDEVLLRVQYHRAAQVTSVLVLSAALVLMAFSPQVMLLWTHDANTVARTHALVTVLAFGTALNGLIHIPYALQLASGWTSLTFYVNTAAVCVLVPLTVVVARQFGAVGVAWLWVALNSTYVVVTVPLMHRRLLRGDLWRWYSIDIGAPLAGALTAVVIGRLAFSPGMPPLQVAGFLAVVSAAALLFAALAAPETRAVLLRAVRRDAPVATG